MCLRWDCDVNQWICFQKRQSLSVCFKGFLNDEVLRFCLLSDRLIEIEMIPVRPRAVTITIDEAREASGLLQVPPGAHVCCSARAASRSVNNCPAPNATATLGFLDIIVNDFPGSYQAAKPGSQRRHPARCHGFLILLGVRGQFASRQALCGSDARRQQCLRVLRRDALIASLKILND